MAIRRALPTPALPSSPTACRILPARSPASWPVSTGRRRMRRTAHGSPASPAIARSCRRICCARLHEARVAAGTPLACARSGEWRHPVVGLWPIALREDLRRALVGEGSAQDRALDRTARHRACRLAGHARSTRSSTSTRRRMRRGPRRSRGNIPICRPPFRDGRSEDRASTRYADQSGVRKKSDRRTRLDFGHILCQFRQGRRFR